jgi:hypothetical protein
MDDVILSKLSDKQLPKKYQYDLASYREWINKEINLNEDWLEEAEYMSFARGELHKIVEEFRHRSLKNDFSELQALDKRWQTWILNHSDPDFKLEHPRERMPKSRWWEWVDELGTLTDEQRKTL